MDNARGAINADTKRVRVTTWSFDDGSATGFHRHEFDYVVVPITGGTFEVVDRDGATRELTQEAGVAYLGVEGTSHDVVNRSGRPASFVEIELKH
ncbi:MAG: cupin domain-containing protein [Solirubrobacteraceae bacterium]